MNEGPRIDLDEGERLRICAHVRSPLARNLIRIILKKYQLPPDRADAAIELVLKQAEQLTKACSS